MRRHSLTPEERAQLAELVAKKREAEAQGRPYAVRHFADKLDAALGHVEAPKVRPMGAPCLAVAVDESGERQTYKGRRVFPKPTADELARLRRLKVGDV